MATMDKTVLGRYYMFADTSALEAAVLSLQFELDQRAQRDAVATHEKERHEQLAQEIADALKAASKEPA
jgi:hypothetical protein